MITKEGFIEASGVDPERAGKIYDLIDERFEGDWCEVSKYLDELFKYLQKYQ